MWKTFQYHDASMNKNMYEQFIGFADISYISKPWYLMSCVIRVNLEAIHIHVNAWIWQHNRIIDISATRPEVYLGETWPGWLELVDSSQQPNAWISKLHHASYSTVTLLLSTHLMLQENSMQLNLWNSVWFSETGKMSYHFPHFYTTVPRNIMPYTV